MPASKRDIYFKNGKYIFFFAFNFEKREPTLSSIWTSLLMTVKDCAQVCFIVWRIHSMHLCNSTRISLKLRYISEERKANKGLHCRRNFNISKTVAILRRTWARVRRFFSYQLFRKIDIEVRRFSAPRHAIVSLAGTFGHIRSIYFGYAFCMSTPFLRKARITCISRNIRARKQKVAKINLLFISPNFELEQPYVQVIKE